MEIKSEGLVVALNDFARSTLGGLGSDASHVEESCLTLEEFREGETSKWKGVEKGRTQKKQPTISKPTPSSLYSFNVKGWLEH